MLVAEEVVEIRVLRQQGKSVRGIARLLELSRNTVRSYLRSEGPQRLNAYTATPYIAINASLASFSSSAVMSKFRVLAILWLMPYL